MGEARPVYILSAVRTPLGAYGGAFKTLTSADLGAVALREALMRAGMERHCPDQILLGSVLQAGCGPNPALQAARRAGLSPSIPATTINMGRASGLKALALATQSIATLESEMILAGGMENLSSAPYLLPAARWGCRMGSAQAKDSILVDGLEHVLEPTLPSLEQARFATESRAKASLACAAGCFAREIATVSYEMRRSLIKQDKDENFGRSMDPDTLKEGPPMADGAAVLVLASASVSGNFKPLARILGFAQASGNAAHAGSGCAIALATLMKQTGLAFSAVDRWELDESSVASVLTTLQQHREIDPARTNVRGGALALGHPLGASGARIVVTLLHCLQDEGLRYGVAAMETHNVGLAMAVECLS